jgi:hypothetical protein
MLRYIYDLDFEFYDSDDPPDCSIPLTFYAKMYSMGDKYLLPDLKEAVKRRLKIDLPFCWDTDDFTQAIVETFESTPYNDGGLRKIFVKATRRHIDELLEKEHFRRVLENATGFAADVIREMKSEDKDRPVFTCNECDVDWDEDELLPHDPVFDRIFVFCPVCGAMVGNWVKIRGADPDKKMEQASSRPRRAARS